MKLKGRLSNWDDNRGFGFVEPSGGGMRSFVHIKAFPRGSRRPNEGELIVYEQVKASNGKYKARNVKIVSDLNTQFEKPFRKGTLGAGFVAVFCLILAATAAFEIIPIEILYLYIATSAITFIVYALDKSAAKNNRWRTPESNLHALSLAGGWPGAFLAQKILRHKSSKKEFKVVYWATVLINIAAFIWLLTEQGQQFFKTIIG